MLSANFKATLSYDLILNDFYNVKFKIVPYNKLVKGFKLRMISNLKLFESNIIFKQIAECKSFGPLKNEEMLMSFDDQGYLLIDYTSTNLYWNQLR